MSKAQRLSTRESLRRVGRPHDAGDTLIEVLVSILILSIISMTAFLGFGTLISSSAVYRNLATMNNVLMSASTQATSELQNQSPPLYLTCATAADYQAGGSNALTFPDIPSNYSVTVSNVLFWNAPSFSSQCSSVSTYLATASGTSPNYVYSCPNGGTLSGTTCTVTLYSESEELTLVVTNLTNHTSQSTSFVVNNPYSSPAPTDNTVTQLIFTQQPGNVMVGQDFSPNVTVEVANLKGAVVTSDASTMILTLTPDTGSPGASMSSTCQGTENLGVFTFTNCNIQGTSIGNGGYTLTATDGLLTATSNPFGVTEQLDAPAITAMNPSTTVAGAVMVVYTGSANAPSGQNYSLTICTNSAMTTGCLTQGTISSGGIVQNLTPGTAYYATVTATATTWFLPATSPVFGPSTATVQLDTPIITQLSTSTTTPGAIVIDYTGSANAPSGQTYSATACTNEAMTQNCVTESTYTSGTQFTGLTYGGNYYVTVTAVASPGYLAATSGVAGPVMALGTVPGPPTNVVATGGNASASVTWSPPTNDGGLTIGEYIVTAVDQTTPANGGEICTTVTTSCTVSGLTNGDTYVFSVVAVNGIGPSSPAISNSVVPSTTPNAPTALSATTGSASSYAASYVQVGLTPTMTYTCPSGGTLSGTTCTVTTTSTYAATLNSSGYYSCPSGGTLSGSTCTTTSTSTYAASEEGSCSSGWTLGGSYGAWYCYRVISSTEANCVNNGGSYNSSNGTCTLTTSATISWYCPSGGTLSNTTCTVTTTSSYAATYNNTSYYSCPSGGTLSGSTCTTTSTSTYTATSSEAMNYSCPSGETLSGSSCTTTSSYAASLTSTGGGTSYSYSCPNGGTLEGSSCVSTATATTAPSTYPASVYPPTSPISQSCPSGTVLNTSTGQCSSTQEVGGGGLTVTQAQSICSSSGGTWYIANPSLGTSNGYCTTYTSSTTRQVQYCPEGGTPVNGQCTTPSTTGSFAASPVNTYTCPSGWSGGGTSPICSRTFLSGQANCLNNGGTYGGGSCSKSINASVTTTYSCPAGDSQSGSTCTPPPSSYSVPVSYSAPPSVVTYAPTQTYTCPAGGTLSGTNCVTTNSYPAIATPAAETPVYGYICPSGGTLSGTTCNIAASGPGAAIIEWTDTPTSLDGGSPITGYTITAVDSTTPSNGGQSCTVAASATTCVITGLIGNDTYTFVGVATNANGSSATPSAASNSVVPVSSPAAPTGVTATAGTQQATVSWTAPTNDGGSPITGYTVIASDSTNSANGGQTCTTTGATTCTVTGLTGGDTYTFVVTATNTYGASPASTPSNAVIPLSAPQPPTGVTATAGTGQATVSWTAPANDGGSPITGYTVTSSGGQTCTTTGATTCTVTGLTGGDSYTFTVTATNAIGTSSASVASNSVTALGVPQAPTGVTVSIASSSSIAVSWTAPTNDGGSAITGYTVTSSGGQTCTTTGATTCTVTGLTTGTSYTFTVTATNAIGTSSASSPSNAIAPATAPSVPTGVTATVASGTSATVSWTAPTNDGGSAITGYTVTSSGGQTCTTTGATTCTVTGLAGGGTYTFTVVATNAAGNSPSSSPSNSVTMDSVPNAPTGVTATVASGTSATVSWTASTNDGGSPITGYTVTSSGGQTCTTTGATTCTVTGLTGGDSYTFTVVATNAVGNSPSSSLSNSVTLPTVFNYTGGTQTFIVPSGVYSLNVTMSGASGGNATVGSGGSSGGGGATIGGTLAVTPGEQLTIVVGGMGGSGGPASYGYNGAGGYSGGYTGGSGGVDEYNNYGGGGGGATQILSGGSELAVAGGGGGAGVYYDPYPTYYGAWGGQSGSTGVAGGYSGGSSGYGAGGTGAFTTSGGNYYGVFGSGGSVGSGYAGGGGGAGYYGGGGSLYGGGGGGGSSYVPSGMNVTGNNTGNGSVSITY